MKRKTETEEPENNHRSPRGKRPVLSSYRLRYALARTLFCCPQFAMRDFRQMDSEDWQLHAARAWEIAGIFIDKTQYQRTLNRAFSRDNPGKFSSGEIARFPNIKDKTPNG
jgi:hypothetical protein